MDQEAVLSAFNEQVRRQAGHSGPDELVEREGLVVRIISDGWSGVTWSDLDPATADAVIARQVDRFAQLARPWEWKHYSYDQPVDLPERLAAAGLTAEPAETLLVAEIADLAVDVPPPVGVQLMPVVDEQGIEAFVRMHADVFGGDHSAIGRTLLAGLSQERPSDLAVIVAVIAWFEGTAVGAGRVELQPGTDFASIWGGGTLPAWRGRGVFRSMVAYRAALASARGFRYLQVDASPDSRPILRRLGFVELATTTPFAHPGA
ncbi:MAG: GNAT family N-acetyltransferase [Dermatophilaceae bacterium]